MNRAQRRAAARNVSMSSVARSKRPQLRKDLAAALREFGAVEQARKAEADQEARVGRLGLTVVKARELLRIGGER